MNHFKFKYLTACIFIFSLSTAELHANNWQVVQELKGEWKFRIGDNMSWRQPAYNDSNWDRIRVPAAWETQGFHAYDGYGWYRKSFTLNSNQGLTNLYLSLGYIDDADEVYLNGKLIGFSGAFPPYYRTAYNAYRRYPIPKELLLPKGENVIAVRTYDAKLDGGIITGMVAIVYHPDNDMLDIDLSGVWNFRLGDQLSWKNPTASREKWEKTMVPSFWEKQGFSDYDGYAWYFRQFYLPARLENEELVLLLGKIDDFDQTYINGQLVGSTGFDEEGNFDPEDIISYSMVRKYHLPNSKLNFGGMNVLAVRVYDKYIDGGIYAGPIGIIRQQFYTEFWRKWYN
ncbi:MAG: beta galactosidase jelly roll domain-containing protein [Cyclobacteriaceae bacterium]